MKKCGHDSERIACAVAAWIVAAGLRAHAISPVPEFFGAAQQSYVAIGTPAALQIADNNPFTVEGWMAFKSLKARDILYSKNNAKDGPSYTYLLGFSDNNLTAYDGAAWRGNFAVSRQLNRWYHVAFSFDGTTMAFYLDGDLLGTYAPFSFSNDETHSIKLGGYLGFTGDLNGYKRDVRVWDHARSQEEIQQNMHRPLAGSEAGLLAYWPLTEGDGDDVYDLTANANHGTLVGADWTTTDTPPVQAIWNTAASNMTATSATLIGTLTSTGTSATAVSGYWGTADGLDDPDAWGAQADFGVTSETPPVDFSTNVTGLTANQTYYYRFAASNDAGRAWASPVGIFMTGAVRIEKDADAYEADFVSGVFSVHRDPALTNAPVTVYYERHASSTAEEGLNYQPLSGSVTIAAGASNATITVNPLLDINNVNDTELRLDLVPGGYVLDVNTHATMTIHAIEIPGAPTNTWIGVGNASVADNWSLGVPQNGHDILLGVYSTGNLTWDAGVNGLPDTVASWTQTEDYSGTVTLETRYPGQGAFSNLVIAGDCVLSNGVWTHPVNSGGDTAVDRLAVSVGGDFALVAPATVNVNLRGFAGGRGPGAGGTGQRSANGAGASHGGQGAWGNAGGTPPPTYGSFTEPSMPGSGANTRGGGAVWLKIGGTATIAGNILADGGDASQSAGGAGGSIYLEADSLAGAGLLRVRGGGPSFLPGGGGRVGVVLRDSDTFGDAGFRMQAHGHTRGHGDGPDFRSAAGTVYRQSPDRRELIIDNSLNPITATNVYSTIPAEWETYDPPPAVTGELANVTLIAPDNAQAHIRLADSVRMWDLGRLGANSTLDLTTYTLYFKTNAPPDFPDLSEPSTDPVNVPAALGGGTIWPNDGRILWDDEIITMRFFAWAGPNGAIDNYDPDTLYPYLGTMTITGTPAAGHTFIRWLGSIPTGEDPFTPELTLDVIPELHFRAVFASTAADTRTWIGGGTDVLAGTATNWYPEGVPLNGEQIILNEASFSQLTWDTGIVDLFERWDAWLDHSVNLNWNIEVEPGSWTQSEWYSATVTIPTRFPGWGTFTNLNIHGNCTLDNGTWIHNVNAGGAVGNDETDRLSVSVGGDFTLGSRARISATGRGFANTRGPGAGNTAQRDVTGYGASHGGQGGWGSSVDAPAPTYGSIVEPLTLGSGANGRGGGAILLTVIGNAQIDGMLQADGTSGTNLQPSGAGGSILLRAARLFGAGRLQARGSYGGFQIGGGGRIAVILAETNDFGDVIFDASGNIRGALGDGPDIRSAAGTVYLEGVATSGLGTGVRQARLLIDNRNIDTTPARVRTPLPSDLSVPGCPPVCLEGYYAALTITNRAEAQLNTSQRMRDLFLHTNTPTHLHLQGHTLYLRSPYHEDWGHEDWVTYADGEIIWSLRGTIIQLR